MRQKPAAVRAAANIGRTGVDEIMQILLQYSGGTLVFLESGLIDEERQEVRIVGTEGTMCINNFWYADRLTIQHRDGRAEEIQMEDHTEIWTPERHDYQLLQFADCVRNGGGTQNLWSAEDSLAVYEIMEDAFRQIGIIW